MPYTIAQKKALVDLLDDFHSISGAKLQKVLGEHFSATFTQVLSATKAPTLQVKSPAEGGPENSELIKLALGLPTTTRHPFDPIRFNNDALNKLIRLQPENVQLWGLLKSCIPTPPLSLEQRITNYIELINHIKKGRYEVKDRADLAFPLVAKAYSIARANYAAKERLDREFSSTSHLGKWFRKCGYNDAIEEEIALVPAYASSAGAGSGMRAEASINPAAIVKAWQTQQLLFHSKHPTAIDLLTEVAKTEISAIQELHMLSDQIDKMMTVVSRLSKSQKAFLGEVKVHVDSFLALNSHVQIAKVFEDPTASPETVSQLMKATYDTLMQHGYGDLLLRMIEKQSDLDVLYTAYKDDIDLNLKPTLETLRREIITLSQHNEALKTALAGNTREELRALFASTNPVILELKAGNYERQLITRPELAAFIEGGCNTDGLSDDVIFTLITQLKSMGFVTDSLAQQQQWIGGGIPSTSAKPLQHIVQRKLHFQRFNDEPTLSDVAYPLVRVFDELSNAGNTNQKLAEAEIMARRDFPKAQKEKALRLLVALEHSKLSTPERNEYTKTILQKAYPKPFEDIRHIDLKIAFALGISSADAELNIDPTRFQPTELTALYEETKNPLWLVLKMMANPDDKIEICLFLANAFKRKNLGRHNKYEPVLDLIRTARAAATEKDLSLLQDHFGPDSELGQWLITKARTKKGISLKYDSEEKVRAVLPSAPAIPVHRSESGEILKAASVSSVSTSSLTPASGDGVASQQTSPASEDEDAAHVHDTGLLSSLRGGDDMTAATPIVHAAPASPVPLVVVPQASPVGDDGEAVESSPVLVAGLAPSLDGGDDVTTAMPAVHAASPVPLAAVPQASPVGGDREAGEPRSAPPLTLSMRGRLEAMRLQGVPSTVSPVPVDGPVTAATASTESVLDARSHHHPTADRASRIAAMQPHQAPNTEDSAPASGMPLVSEVRAKKAATKRRPAPDDVQLHPSLDMPMPVVTVPQYGPATAAKAIKVTTAHKSALNPATADRPSRIAATRPHQAPNTADFAPASGIPLVPEARAKAATKRRPAPDDVQLHPSLANKGAGVRATQPNAVPAAQVTPRERLRLLFIELSQRPATKNSSMVKKVMQMLNSSLSLREIEKTIRAMASDRQNRYLSKFNGMGFSGRDQHIIQPLYDLIVKKGHNFRINDDFCLTMEKRLQPFNQSNIVRVNTILDKLKTACQTYNQHTGMARILEQLNALADPNESLVAVQKIASERVNRSWSKSHFFGKGRDEFVQKVYDIMSKYNSSNAIRCLKQLNVLLSPKKKDVITHKPPAK